MYHFLPINAEAAETIHAKTETSLVIQINEYLMRKYQDAPVCDQQYMQIKGIRIVQDGISEHKVPLSDPVIPVYGDERDAKTQPPLGYVTVTSDPLLGFTTQGSKLVRCTTPVDLIDRSTDPRDSFVVTRKLIVEQKYDELFSNDPNGLMLLRMIQGCDKQSDGDTDMWLQTRIDLYLAAKWFFQAIGIRSCDDFTVICEFYYSSAYSK